METGFLGIFDLQRPAKGAVEKGVEKMVCLPNVFPALSLLIVFNAQQ
jgi:hypothetical protein